MTACLFGTYVRAHSANRLLREALAGAGFALAECHEPVWEEEGNKPRRYFGLPSLARLAARYAAAARQLARRWRALSGPPPLVVVGFGGQLDALLARRLCRPRAALVFAPLVTLSETLVEDRRVFPVAGLRARALAALDRAALAAADLVLVDTAAHAAYLARLGVGYDRMAVWHLGAEPEFFAPRASPRSRPALMSTSWSAVDSWFAAGPLGRNAPASFIAAIRTGMCPMLAPKLIADLPVRSR